jgi:hypothetical protein
MIQTTRIQKKVAAECERMWTVSRTPKGVF